MVTFMLIILLQNVINSVDDMNVWKAMIKGGNLRRSGSVL